jgi:hypothetical protein
MARFFNCTFDFEEGKIFLKCTTYEEMTKALVSLCLSYKFLQERNKEAANASEILLLFAILKWCYIWKKKETKSSSLTKNMAFLSLQVHNL